VRYVLFPTLPGMFATVRRCGDGGEPTPVREDNASGVAAPLRRRTPWVLHVGRRERGRGAPGPALHDCAAVTPSVLSPPLTFLRVLCSFVTLGLTEACTVSPFCQKSFDAVSVCQSAIAYSCGSRKGRGIGRGCTDTCCPVTAHRPD
jgi:hypothetical protein